ncbi:hypothetical protein Tdes44962_MAKER07938 [Teratosphaeria destructans]|uniref:Uncharacterized protein n=1 Tax=Teratosphaeria destructans TaxID=418781 RepID=A0A9W7SXU3_9PEZI|nr:hypothetical protein Tdes44962_MAKER07938 [Teratosphaeria destructans]
MSTSSPRRPPRHPPTPPPPSQRTPGASYPSTTAPFVVRHRNQSPSSDALRAAAASITRDGASTTRQAKPGRAASPAASLRSDASSSTADSTALRRAAADLAQRYGSRDSSRRGSLAEHHRGGQVGQGGGGRNQGDEDTVGLGSWAIGLPGSFPPSWENDSDDGDDTGHDDEMWWGWG